MFQTEDAFPFSLAEKRGEKGKIILTYQILIFRSVKENITECTKLCS